MAIPLTFQHVRESLGLLQSEHDLDITQDFLEALGAEEKELTAEIIRLEDSLPVLKRGLESLWEDAREHEYELVSVFMHRGEAPLRHQFRKKSYPLTWSQRQDERGRPLLDIPVPPPDRPRAVLQIQRRDRHSRPGE